MSDVAYQTPEVAQLPAAKRDEVMWRSRIEAAHHYRRPFEAGWLGSLAFVAGNQWVTWDRHTRTLRDISEVDERYAGVDLYVADIITEQRAAALGELQSDSDRPELLAPGNADESPDDESIQQQANRAISHVWDFEADADQQLSDMDRKVVDLGVGAIRVRFDKYAGKQMVSSKGEPVSAPIGPDGVPITKAEDARAYVGDTASNGGTAKFTPVNEGCICWETGSAFNLLTPPGIPHEKDFPWEIWVRPAHLDEVKDEYPAAADMVADSDIGSILGTSVPQNTTTNSTGQSVGRLADHVWLYTCYQRPTKKYPKGRVAVLAGAGKRLLQTREELPYQTLDGDWCSGIVYFHWWRLTDRFYSRSLIETLKDPQRMTNRTATQTQEIIDRSMPFGIVQEDTLPQKPSGRPMEWVELKQGTTVQPQFISGPGPGPWMQQHREQLMADAQHASTLSALKLGENPTNVDTYSQLSLLQDQEAAKRSTIRSERQQGIAKLVEYSLLDVTRFWSDGKQLIVAGGPENELQVHDFQKSQIPPLYLVRPAKGSAKPQSQASNIQLIADIWAAAIASTAYLSNPIAWVEWLKDSYAAGEVLELPTPPADNQADVAERENHELLNGDQPPVAYWDIITTHLPIHRAAEDQARMAGDVESLRRIETHIKEHQDAAAANAAQLAASTPQPIIPGAAPVLPGQTSPAQLGPPQGAPGALGAGPPPPAPPLGAPPGGPPPAAPPGP